MLIKSYISVRRSGFNDEQRSAKNDHSWRDCQPDVSRCSEITRCGWLSMDDMVGTAADCHCSLHVVEALGHSNTCWSHRNDSSNSTQWHHCQICKEISGNLNIIILFIQIIHQWLKNTVVENLYIKYDSFGFLYETSRLTQNCCSRCIAFGSAAGQMLFSVKSAECEVKS